MSFFKKITKEFEAFGIGDKKEEKKEEAPPPAPAQSSEGE